jgi:hypothetical protein
MCAAAKATTTDWNHAYEGCIPRIHGVNHNVMTRMGRSRSSKIEFVELEMGAPNKVSYAC